MPIQKPSPKSLLKPMTVLQAEPQAPFTPRSGGNCSHIITVINSQKSESIKTGINLWILFTRYFGNTPEKWIFYIHICCKKEI